MARRCSYNYGTVDTAVVVPSTATKARHRLGGALKAVVLALTATRERAPHVHGISQRVVEEALPDAPILSDEEDEKLYPGYVHQNNEEHAANEDYIPAEFSHTDEDERREDHDIGAFEDADEDRPIMMYDRDNPSIDEGVVFPEAVDCRNAVGTFSIKFETEYITLKSDQSSLEVSSVMVTLLQPHHKSASFNPHFFLSQSLAKL
ncbi:hypothetical protein D1007_45879 [Hordeum vulgare]|nr:hypothetical protein D1007_45879 [Hordeum vulgare]